MRPLLGFLLALCLFAGVANGAVSHALEHSGFGGVTEATQGLHADGDRDQVPADAHGNSPHHHNICHGHELGTPLKTCGAPVQFVRRLVLKPVSQPALASDPPPHVLRPPIA